MEGVARPGSLALASLASRRLSHFASAKSALGIHAWSLQVLVPEPAAAPSR